MATVTELVASISKNAGIDHSIVAQAARRLREDDHLPTSSNCRSAQVSSDEVTLLLLASLAATTANSATRTALAYAALCYDGASGPDGNGEWPTTLHNHLTRLIEAAWKRNHVLPFGELILDLTVPAAATKLYPTVAGQALAVNSNFVAPGEDSDAWSTKKVRQESRLPAEAFYGIIADLQHADAVGKPRYRRGSRHAR